MSELQINTQQLNDLIIKGDTLKAMELFYADNITMQENEDAPRIGKQVCLHNEQQNIQRVKEFKAKLLKQAIDNKNNIVFSEWEIVFTTNNNTKVKVIQVSVQQWNKGQIVQEKFYYKDFYPLN